MLNLLIQLRVLLEGFLFWLMAELESGLQQKAQHSLVAIGNQLHTSPNMTCLAVMTFGAEMKAIGRSSLENCPTTAMTLLQVGVAMSLSPDYEPSFLMVAGVVPSPSPGASRRRRKRRFELVQYPIAIGRKA